jgi:hypothetical protein
MIRREITAADGTKLWLLVSQVHHAQMGGELARYWREPFSTDVLDAIAHHDDGWTDWEAAPQLNKATGIPYSFLEMPLEDSLAIWDRSIAAARQFGPLGGYIVAGHFYSLLQESEHAEEGPTIAWLMAKRKARTAWIDEWLRINPTHALDYAKRAQQMLQIADLFSLWLCCDCPVDENQQSVLSQSQMKLRSEMLLGQFRLTTSECMAGRSERADRLTGFAWRVTVDPYPYRDSLPPLSVKAIAVPAHRYAHWDEVLAAGWAVQLDWRLVSKANSSTQ